MNWDSIRDDAKVIFRATNEEDRIGLVNGIFRLCCTILGDHDFGIIRDTEDEANTIADFFDDLYGTNTCVTGSVDEEGEEHGYCNII